MRTHSAHTCAPTAPTHAHPQTTMHCFIVCLILLPAQVFAYRKGQLVSLSARLVSVCMCALCCVCMQGLDESIRDRLCDFTFNVSEVGIFPARSLPLADQPAAFKSMLQQLSDLDAPDALVVTRGWHWTVDMLKIAAEYVPKLDHLRVQVRVLP